MKSKGQVFVDELRARGFIYQCTDVESLIGALNDESHPAAYIGFDCTAKSLHVGNLMQIMILRLMQRCGIRPVILVGGGTTKIGDPSDKDQMRKMLSIEEIQANIEGIKHSLSKFLDFSNPKTGAVLVNNAEWLDELNYLGFLRDYGKFFSINRMISFDKIKRRLEQEQNLTFLEFNYMILQAYDYMHLNQKYNCILQCGGSDQWGNIVSGVDLVRRVNAKEVFGLTTPLITTASGAKMGKTAEGAKWLNESMLSPFDFYQFWRNVDDADIFKFMRIYTEIPLGTVEEYQKDTSININEYKKILAKEVTMLCYGKDIAENVHNQAIEIFENNNKSELNEVIIDKSIFKNGEVFAYELFKIAGLAQSNGEAKRLIGGNGAKINDHKIVDEHHKILVSDFMDGFIILSSGKKKHVKLLLN
jgi:tyrosyl-tRNA synthetase